jgi:tetratricopeptide (TPR) repeat protein
MRAGFTARVFLHLLLLLIILLAAPSRLHAQANEVPAAEAPKPADMPTPPAPPPDDGLAAAARLIEALREQQESNQRTIEALKEQAAGARHQAEVTSARLKLIEMTLAERHDERRASELAELQATSRLHFTVVAVVAATALVALAVMAFFLYRATGRLAELPRALAHLPAPGTGVGRLLLAGSTSAEANERLLHVVGLLEKKFGDLEHAVDTLPGPGPATVLEGGANGIAPNGNGHGRAPQGEGQPVRALLARGQQLLDDDAAEEALRVFDQAVAADPRNTDALVKRGKALEKLGRMEDALRSYDRALELDGSLTIAHLSKGGVYNRLDRFGEALECYERALQTQAAPPLTKVAA